MGMGGQRHALAALAPERDPVPITPRGPLTGFIQSIQLKSGPFTKP